MQVAMTKGQGLYNKPSDAVHPGALAGGTLPQYNTRRPITTLDCFLLKDSLGRFSSQSVGTDRRTDRS